MTWHIKEHRKNVSSDLNEIMMMGQKDLTNEVIINANEKVYKNLKYIIEIMKKEEVIPNSQKKESNET